MQALQQRRIERERDRNIELRAQTLERLANHVRQSHKVATTRYQQDNHDEDEEDLDTQTGAAFATLRSKMRAKQHNHARLMSKRKASKRPVGWMHRTKKQN